ncbi:hypothetical protein LIX60_25390 [Streptomyces sp. S07_1.15]|uniref:hypothetical protein n=1 Tax=Streptomyces sp. S07_1.15 TaxID=2873925 RepID=UPI001D15BDF4|nr:hypothetical protein [Streptomyces sp. S07_1.15]MCC3654738.1 hypothetical protein [Streptomyces sp. S07_1.15]
MTEINRRELDYDRLLNLKALSTWTYDRQGEHGEDARAYEAALASFQAHLRSQHVEGDGRRSAVRRSRKVEKHLKALVKASRRAERAAEELRTSYATHVAHVAALPGQREAKAIKRGDRRQALGEITAKSLHKTAAAAAPAEETPQAPAPADGPRGLGDLWKQQRKGA